MSIRYYKSLVNDDTTANGGSVNYYSRITDGGLENVFPSLTEEERLDSDFERNRKIFCQYAGAGIIYNTYAILKTLPYTGDRLMMTSGTLADTQADLSGSYQWHGNGDLANELVGGVTDTIYIGATTSSSFSDGDYVLIAELDEDEIYTTNHEIVQATSAAWNEGLQMIVLNPIVNARGGSTVRKSFSPSANKVTVSSCVPIGNVTASAYDLDNPGSGVRGLNSLPTVNNLGTIDDEWTLEFTDDTNFEITRAGEPSFLEEGSIDSTVSIVNPITGNPYFVVNSNQWMDGTYIEGDAVVFKTKSSLFSLWVNMKPNSGWGVAYGVQHVISIIGE